MILSSKRGRLAPDQAQLNALSPGAQYGLGLFETLRTWPGGKFFLAQEHLRRLYQSAEELGIHFQVTQMRAMELLESMAGSNSSSLRIKIMGLEGELIFISEILHEDPELIDGVRLLPVDQTRSLPQYKSLNYLDCLLAWNQAHEAGCFDAILIDQLGYCRETSRANLFWVRGGQIYSNQEKSLPGITQSFLFAHAPRKVQPSQIQLAGLRAVDEIFITNSIRGVLPVKQIQDQNFALGPITREIMDFYQSSL